MLTADIQTTIVPPKRRVWRCFPGRQYQFLSDFDRNSEIFLDFPDLTPSHGLRGDDNNLFAKVRASQQHRRELIGQTSLEGPTGKWENFTDIKITSHLGKLVRSVINFYDELAKHDIVIVPDSISSGTILFGEVLDEKGNTNTTTFHKYGSATLPMKRVRWITRTSDDKLSKDLVRSLRNENNLTSISRLNYNEVFFILLQ